MRKWIGILMAVGFCLCAGCGDVQRGLAVLWILLGRLRSEVFLHGDLQSCGQCLRGILYTFEIL